MQAPSCKRNRYLTVPSIFDTSFSSTLGRVSRAISISFALRGFERVVISLIGTPFANSGNICFARNFGWHIIPCGDTALNLLKLSTQVPAVWQYVSDGPYREYAIGNLQLKFKHTSNKDISGQSYKTALITQALKALGKDYIDDTIRNKLSAVLTTEDLSIALAETQHGTVWIYETIKSIVGKEEPK